MGSLENYWEKPGFDQAQMRKEGAGQPQPREVGPGTVATGSRQQMLLQALQKEF